MLDGVYVCGTKRTFLLPPMIHIVQSLGRVLDEVTEPSPQIEHSVFCFTPMAPLSPLHSLSLW